MARHGATSGPARAFGAAAALIVAAVAVVALPAPAAVRGAEAPVPPPWRCFGAAARDPVHPCSDPALRLVVFPAPEDAPKAAYAPCDVLSLPDGLVPCRFADAAPGGAEAALVGDSHAGHWRAAVAQVARARGWGATSLTKSGCPFTFARLARPGRFSHLCRAWSGQVVTWFRHHPRAHTAFVSAHAGAEMAPAPGQSAYETAVAGFDAAWRALPPTVRTVVVLRDVPVRPVVTRRCVERAIAHRLPAGQRCAERRTAVLHRDPAASAVRRHPLGRGRIADLTPLMCSRSSCFPVIGGALVNKDQSHLTTAFATTLGPYLVRRVDAVVPTG